MLVDVDFQASRYGTEVSRILLLAGGGTRPMPLTQAGCTCESAYAVLKGASASNLFPAAESPEGALSGLHLYFSCFDEAHRVAQDLATPEGSFWHGILHRQEPDPANAAYWFRRVGKHAIFPALCDEARRLRYDTGREWNPLEFVDFCESARSRKGSDEEDIAVRVQLVEWQLLFDYCAREKTK